MKLKYFLTLLLPIFLLSCNKNCNSNTPLSFKGIYLGCPKDSIRKILSKDPTISSLSEGRYLSFFTHIIGYNEKPIYGHCDIILKDEKVYSISFNINVEGNVREELPNIYKLYTDKYGNYEKRDLSQKFPDYVWNWDNQSITISYRVKDTTWREILKNTINLDNLSYNIQRNMDGPNDITITYQAILQEDLEEMKKLKEQEKEQELLKEKREKEEKNYYKRLKKEQDI